MNHVRSSVSPTRISTSGNPKCAADPTPRGEAPAQEDVDMEVPAEEEEDDEASRLRDLATDVRDQDDLERAIGRQV